MTAPYYRLQPEFGFLDHLTDAKRVLAWARERGPSTLVVSGSSAGAHLTALCAFTPNDPRLQPGFEDADTTMDAAVCMNAYLGKYDDSLDGRTSPWDCIRPDAPPFLVVHGTHDPLVPVEHTRAFVERLADVRYIELPGGQHGFDLFHSPASRP
nr:hypothetical protein GCM10020063_048650 [Dactylosporangium thailandense]